MTAAQSGHRGNCTPKGGEATHILPWTLSHSSSVHQSVAQRDCDRVLCLTPRAPTSPGVLLGADAVRCRLAHPHAGERARDG